MRPSTRIRKISRVACERVNGARPSSDMVTRANRSSSCSRARSARIRSESLCGFRPTLGVASKTPFSDVATRARQTGPAWSNGCATTLVGNAGTLRRAFATLSSHLAASKTMDAGFATLRGTQRAFGASPSLAVAHPPVRSDASHW